MESKGWEIYQWNCKQNINQEYLLISNKLQTDKRTLLQQLEHSKQQQYIQIKDSTRWSYKLEEGDEEHTGSDNEDPRRK